MKLIQKVVGAAMVIAIAIVMTGCVELAAQRCAENSISGNEVLSLLQQRFPNLRVGKELFITTGKYMSFSLPSYKDVYNRVTNLPSCRWKASVVVLGEFHSQLNPLVAAGIAEGVPGKSPAWFVVLLDSCRNLYGLDPVTGNIWLLSATDVILLII